MPTNATATVIAVISTPVKVAGTWTDVLSSRFTNDNTGRMTYNGSRDIIADVMLTLTCSKTVNGTDTYLLHVFKNGVDSPNIRAEFAMDNSRDPNVALSGLLNMATGDYIELYVESTTGTDDITMTAANFRHPNLNSRGYETHLHPAYKQSRSPSRRPE